MKKLIAICIVVCLVPFFFTSAGADDDYAEKVMALIDEDLVLYYLQSLQDIGPRVTEQPACTAAAEFIYNEFLSYGYETHYLEWNHSGYEDRNVEAILPGETEASVIICAHYDTVPESPGVDDNGSGAAAVLAAAKALSQYKDEISLNYTIRFITFSGEEEGLHGSWVYANQAASDGMSIVAVLNADMIGYTRTETGKENVVVYTRDTSEWIAGIAGTISVNYNLGLAINTYNAGAGSDHYPFLSKGYDAVFFAEYEFNDYYHSPEDTIEHMDIPYDTLVTKLVAGTLMKIADIEIVDNKPPELSLERPSAFLYIADREIIPLEKTVIVGKITTEISAYDTLSGVSRVELYVDGLLKTTLVAEPYQWVWDEFAFFGHELKAVAYDNIGNSADKTVNVTIFNI